MSTADSYAEAFAPILSHNKSIVSGLTWGHLAPIKNKTYKIDILFSVSSYNSEGISLVDTKYSDELDDSPWLFEAIQAMLFDKKKEMSLRPGIYLFKTTFRNFRWWVKCEKIYKLH